LERARLPYTADAAICSWTSSVSAGLSFVVAAHTPTAIVSAGPRPPPAFPAPTEA
jgi:hypothetical protein